MRCFRTRGKKGDKHHDPLDPPRRRANKQRGHGTYDNDRPPIVGTVGRHSGQCRLRVRSPYRWQDVATARAWVHPNETPLVTLMNGRAITGSSVLTTRCVMGRKNGRAMTMAMASGRSTPTPSKACGRPRAIFCVPFAGSTRSICTTIWPCANIRSISNASVLSLSLDLSLSTDQ